MAYKTTIKEQGGLVRKLVSTELSNTIVLPDEGGIGVGVYLQDWNKPVLDVRFLHRKGVFQLLSNTTVDSRYFTAASGHLIVVGDTIELNKINNFIQAIVLSVVGDLIEIDSPIGDIYTPNRNYPRSSNDMRVDGSTNPVVFTLKPEEGQKGNITGMFLNILAAGGMDFSTFGSGAKLARGCILRKKNTDGTYTNYFNWKDNSEFISRANTHYFKDNNGNNVRSFAGRVVFAGQENKGVSISLTGTLGEELQIVVQDNLLELSQNSIAATAQGSTSLG